MKTTERLVRQQFTSHHNSLTGSELRARRLVERLVGNSPYEAPTNREAQALVWSARAPLASVVVRSLNGEALAIWVRRAVRRVRISGAVGIVDAIWRETTSIPAVGV
jgi:hypothetical protein